MSQDNILEFFKKNREEWLTAKELKPRFDCNICSINHSLRVLRQNNMIRYRYRKRKKYSGRSPFEYFWKKQ